MASVEDRKAAERGHMPTLLRLIADREISSIGDDYWYIYDDTTPQGHRIWHVDNLIDRGLAKASGYYDVFLTDAGRALQASLAAGGPIPDPYADSDDRECCGHHGLICHVSEEPCCSRCPGEGR